MDLRILLASSKCLHTHTINSIKLCCENTLRNRFCFIKVRSNNIYLCIIKVSQRLLLCLVFMKALRHAVRRPIFVVQVLLLRHLMR